MSSVSPNAEGLPLSLVRVEHNERKFLRHLAGHADGIVIAARFDAPHWPPQDDAQPELPGIPPGGEELKAEALAHRLTYLLDPEPWRLPYLKNRDDRSLNRTARTLCAQAVQLPLTPNGLDTDDLVVPLVRSTVRMQEGAKWLIAPYFTFADSRDPWLEVNLRCLRVMKAVVGDRAFSAWVYVPLSFVSSGNTALVAQRYAKALPRGSTVFLTVCGLDPNLPREVLGAYLRTVLAFQAAGLEVVTDRASELSVPAAALGARGGVLGTRVYRTASDSPRWTSEVNPKIRLRHLVAGRVDRMPKALAIRRTARGSIPACRDAKCQALQPGAGLLVTRLHNAHAFALELAHAADVGPAALAAEWRAFDLKRLTTWAQALEDVMDLSIEA